MRKGLLLCAAALALLCVPTALADVAHVGYPNSMASTGDSITRGFNTCSFPFIDCPQNSWSTGTSSTVNSTRRIAGSLVRCRCEPGTSLSGSPTFVRTLAPGAGSDG